MTNNVIDLESLINQQTECTPQNLGESNHWQYNKRQKIDVGNFQKVSLILKKCINPFALELKI